MLKTPPRTIVVIWRDADGREYRRTRTVHFELGLGPYVKWNNHYLPVEAMQDELHVGIPGPANPKQRP